MTEPSLTMRYHLASDGWLIEQGDGKPVGITMLWPWQVKHDFKGNTFSDQIRTMMTNPENWQPYR